MSRILKKLDSLFTRILPTYRRPMQETVGNHFRLIKDCYYSCHKQHQQCKFHEQSIQNLNFLLIIHIFTIPNATQRINE